VVREHADAQFTLVGTGSEVAQCLRASDELRARGIATRVVAMPCWECFEEQSPEYRASVLRRDISSVSLEAGATLGWSRYVDHAIGIDSFGLSAPGAFLFEHFGLNADAVIHHVTETLGL
jgi:transketolase